MNISIYDFKVKRLNGTEAALEEYRGKVLLIVNTASYCGFTSQYAGLESLYKKFADKGLVGLGFPCNQFAMQEPGDAEKIANFCETNYRISFPMFAKIKVNGFGAEPLYQFLKAKAKGFLGTEAIKWNFTKFLVDRNGNVVARFAPNKSPSDLIADIERLLEISERA